MLTINNHSSANLNCERQVKIQNILKKITKM